MIKKPDCGQILIEAMVALAILTFGILAFLTLLSNSLGLNRVIRDQLVAVYLAEEGVEIVKNIIDSNIIQQKPWNSNLAFSGKRRADYKDTELQPNPNMFLLFDPASGTYNYGTGAPTNFKRIIFISPVGPDEIRVNSTVEWTTRGGGQFEVDLEDHFFNWRS